MSIWKITNDKITISNGTVSFTMIKVPGGEYWIGETPVTQELWEAVMGKNPSHFTNKPTNPVEEVSCNSALEFIRKLNELTSLNFRLPTVKEWEFAARGGSASQGFKYPGSNILDDVCWHRYNSGKTKPVKSKLPNEIGLFDMLGNVMEWCEDEVDVFDRFDKEKNCPILIPRPDTKTHTERILKGGSCMNGENTNTIDFKKTFEPWYHNFHIGFRLALTPVIIGKK